MSSARPLVSLAIVGLAAGCLEGSLSIRLSAAEDPDAGVDAAVADAVADPTCPDAAPTEQAGCDVPGLWCEYGGGAHGRCSTRALCARKAGSGGATEWTTFGPDFPCAPNAAGCPTSFGDAFDASCPVTTGICDYAIGRCACGECAVADGGQRFQWQCRTWADVAPFLDDGGRAPAPATCPAERPRLGTPCTTPDFVCGYDACYGVSLGPYLTCADGTWAVGPQTDICDLPACR